MSRGGGRYVRGEEWICPWVGGMSRVTWVCRGGGYTIGPGIPPSAPTDTDTWSVTDPGFPRGGGASPPGRRQHTILPNFPKNCTELKEFGPGKGVRPSRPP